MRIILDSMDLGEVGDVVLERYGEVTKKLAPKLLHMQEEWYKIMLHRGNVHTYFKTIKVESNDITFYIIPSSYGKADMKKFGANLMLACEFKYQGQKFYSLLTGNLTQISIYTTHMLERYVERHLNDDSPINIETFIKYLKETDSESIGFNECETNKLQWRTPIGNTCGCMLNERVMLHKTFIDKSTLLYGKKKEANDRGNELAKHYVTDMWGLRRLPQGITKHFNFSLK